MKTLILTTFLMSLSALATEIPANCTTKAKKALAKSSALVNDYDGFEDNGRCQLARNKAAITCEIFGSKDEGAAYDTYLVVMNKKCTKALRVELTGEE